MRFSLWRELVPLPSLSLSFFCIIAFSTMIYDRNKRALVFLSNSFFFPFPVLYARRRSDAPRCAGRMSSALLSQHIELTIVFLFLLCARNTWKKKQHIFIAYWTATVVAGAIINRYVGYVTHSIYVNCLSWKPDAVKNKNNWLQSKKKIQHFTSFSIHTLQTFPLLSKLEKQIYRLHTSLQQYYQLVVKSSN